MAQKKKRDQLKIASLYQGGSDRSYGGSGPGSLLDRRNVDYDKPLKGYPSDRQFPSGPVPLAKKKKKKKTRIA